MLACQTNVHAWIDSIHAQRYRHKCRQTLRHKHTQRLKNYITNTHVWKQRNNSFITTQTNTHTKQKNKDLELYCLSTHTHALPWLVTFEHLWHQKWTQVCPQTSLCACCSGPLTKICSESFYIINSSLCFYSCLSSILSATYVSAPKSPRDAWGAHYMLPAFFSSHLFLISTKMHICLCMLIKRRPILSLYLRRPRSVTGCSFPPEGGVAAKNFSCGHLVPANDES